MNAERTPAPVGPTTNHRVDDGVVALEVQPSPGETYQELIAGVGELLTTRNPWRTRSWEFLRTSEVDNRINRSIGFWRRHGPRLGVSADALEIEEHAEGWIRRAATAPIGDPRDFVSVRKDLHRRRFGLIVLVPTRPGVEDVSTMLRAVLATPWDGSGYGYLRGLAAAAVVAESLIVVGNETPRHEPSLLLLGSDRHIATLEKALRG